MAEWSKKYQGLIQSVGIRFPEENWLQLHSVNNFNLHTYRFPNPAPRGLIFFFHGLYNTASSYSHMLQRLNADGFVILAFDHESHGQSGGIKGKVRSLEGYIEDAFNLIQLTIKQKNAIYSIR